MIAADVFVSVNDVALEDYQIKLSRRSWWMWRQTSAMRPCFWICSDHDRTNMNKVYIMDSMNCSSCRNERRLLPFWLRNASQLETNLCPLVCLELKEAQHLLSPQRIAHAEGTKRQSTDTVPDSSQMVLRSVSWWKFQPQLRRDSDNTLLPYSFHVIDSLFSFLLHGEKWYGVYGICI